jgi:putative membrane protein
MVGWDHGYGAGGWIVMMVVMVAFWALVVFAIIAIFRSTGSGAARTVQFGPETGEQRRRDARHILDDRFARGEIDEPEYQARKRTLAEH